MSLVASDGVVLLPKSGLTMTGAVDCPVDFENVLKGSMDDDPNPGAFEDDDAIPIKLADEKPVPKTAGLDGVDVPPLPDVAPNVGAAFPEPKADPNGLDGVDAVPVPRGDVAPNVGAAFPEPKVEPKVGADEPEPKPNVGAEVPEPKAGFEAPVFAPDPNVPEEDPKTPVAGALAENPVLVLDDEVNGDCDPNSVEVWLVLAVEL